MGGKSPTCRELSINLAVYDRVYEAVEDRKDRSARRQVEDLPRTSVAEPYQK